jgi:4-amino-4-deoxy-L-arabinose transferase-like glycosyltransferase
MSKAHRCIPCEDGRKLLVAALILRVGWALASHRFWGYRDDGAYDDGVYLDMARAFLSGGAVHATHPPGYPLFLAVFLSLGEAGISLARWAQIFLSAAIAPLVYRLSLSLETSRRSALIAGALICLNPMLVYFGLRMMSEVLFIFLLLGFFLAWQSAWRSGDVRMAAVAGLVGGVATLTRGVMMPFGGVLALTAWLARRQQPRWAALVAFCGLAWAGAVAPWTLRNWTVHRRFIPVSVQGGWNLYEGQTVDPEEIRFKRASAMGDEVRAKGLTDVFAVDAYFGAKAKAWISENPAQFARLCAVKAARFWRPAPEAPHGGAARFAVGAYSILLFSAAALGLFGTRRHPGASFLLAWIVFLNILHCVFVSDLRYRLPVEPMLAIFAGLGLGALFTGFENPRANAESSSARRR